MDKIKKEQRVVITGIYQIRKCITMAKRVDMFLVEKGSLKSEKDISDFLSKVGDPTIVMYACQNNVTVDGQYFWSEPESRIMAKATNQELIYLLNFLEK